MKPSKQIEEVMNRLNRFEDEHFAEEIKNHVQEAWGHLEEVKSMLQEAGL
jgi:hypothetical protein